MILAWLAFIFGLLGYIPKFFDKDKYPRIHSVITISLLILFSLTFWYERNNSSVELEKSRESNKSLTDNVESLKVEINSLRNVQDSLTSLFQPIIEAANLTYPNMPTASALKVLADNVPALTKGVSRLQPKLVRIEDETQSSFDSERKQLHTIYVFRSQSGFLGGVRIRIRFDNPFDTIIYDIGKLSGSAYKIESGSNITFERDHKGFLFRTNELHEGNDVILHVYSTQNPHIVFDSLSP